MKSYLFWLCVALAWVNLVLLFTGKALEEPHLTQLALISMSACAVGAGINYHLNR
jgi:hypothetical protein